MQKFRNLNITLLVILFTSLNLAQVFGLPITNDIPCKTTILSVSNVTDCNTDKCTVKYSTLVSLPLGINSKMCLAFQGYNDTHINIPKFQVNVTIYDHSHVYPLDLVYLTDDPFVTWETKCTCWPTVNVGDCNSDEVWDKDHIDICIRNKASGKGCLFPGTRSYNQMISLKALPTRKVFTYRTPVENIEMLVETDNADQYYTWNGDAQTRLDIAANLAIDLISSTDVTRPKLSKYILHSNAYPATLFHSDDVNPPGVYNPNKLGWMQFDYQNDTWNMDRTLLKNNMASNLKKCSGTARSDLDVRAYRFSAFETDQILRRQDIRAIYPEARYYDENTFIGNDQWTSYEPTTRLRGMSEKRYISYGADGIQNFRTRFCELKTSSFASPNIFVGQSNLTDVYYMVNWEDGPTFKDPTQSLCIGVTVLRVSTGGFPTATLCRNGTIWYLSNPQGVAAGAYSIYNSDFKLLDPTGVETTCDPFNPPVLKPKITESYHFHLPATTPGSALIKISGELYGIEITEHACPKILGIKHYSLDRTIEITAYSTCGSGVALTTTSLPSAFETKSVILTSTTAKYNLTRAVNSSGEITIGLCSFDKCDTINSKVNFIPYVPPKDQFDFGDNEEEDPDPIDEVPINPDGTVKNLPDLTLSSYFSRLNKWKSWFTFKTTNWWITILEVVKWTVMILVGIIVLVLLYKAICITYHIVSHVKNLKLEWIRYRSGLMKSNYKKA